MSSDAEAVQGLVRKREWPERVRIANIAHSDRDEVELELLPEGDDWGDLPTASYVRAE